MIICVFLKLIDRENWKEWLPFNIPYLLTYSMEESPSWEANCFSASQEIPWILRKPTFPYPFTRAHHLSLSWARSIQNMSPYILKLRLFITVPFRPGSSKWSLFLGFPHQNPVYTSPLHDRCYLPCPSHSSRFHHWNNVWWGVYPRKTKGIIIHNIIWTSI